MIVWKVIELLLVFIKELVIANLQVARFVIFAPKAVEPAIFKYPLAVKKPASITILANMISLTPGTLTIDVNRKEGFLIVHVLHSTDIKQTIEGIKNSFELRIKGILES